MAKICCRLGTLAITVWLWSAGSTIQAATFTETFTGGGTPSAPFPPAPWNPDNWDVQVHVRSAYQQPGTTIAHQAHHGPNCEAPGHDGSVTHDVERVEDTVYQCANHVMTSLRADDYGLISLTPPALVDFSRGPATISFELSTLSASRRDWPDVVIQPFAHSLPLPISENLPDLNGFGQYAIQFELLDGAICPVIYRNFRAAEGANKFTGTCQWYRNIGDLIPLSAQTRQRVEITLSRNRVRVAIPALDLVWDDMNIADLGWDKGLVSLMHHSYTPFKDGNGGPNTWHWDTLEISPAQPIFISQAAPRWVTRDGDSFTFDRAAPENAYLRGSAIGTKLEVSFDGGATWAVTNQQPSLESADKPTWQFFHPVPVGTREVMVRRGAKSVSWWSSGWIAKDLSILSLNTKEPIDPPTPKLSLCRQVNLVQRLVQGRWKTVHRQTRKYRSERCETP